MAQCKHGRHHNFNRINANMPNSTTQAWARDEQIAWHNKEAKEQVFGAEEHITVKRISEKMGNMKKTWKDAKAMQAQSGWGVKPEESEASTNQVLERRCPFFWRLDGFGTASRFNGPMAPISSSASLC